MEAFWAAANDGTNGIEEVAKAYDAYRKTQGPPVPTFTASDSGTYDAYFKHVIAKATPETIVEALRTPFDQANDKKAAMEFIGAALTDDALGSKRSTRVKKLKAIIKLFTAQRLDKTNDVKPALTGPTSGVVSRATQ